MAGRRDRKHEKAPESVRVSSRPGVTAAAGEHLSGALGDGAGKWHLTVDAPFETAVMSLLDTPTGFITNLSRPSDN